MVAKEKEQTKVTSKFYLKDFLEVDLSKDTLCRIGSIDSAKVQNEEVLFTAPLIKQKSLEDKRFFEDDKSIGKVIIRLRIYQNGVVRMMITRTEKEFNDETPMIEMHPSMKMVECHLKQEKDGWLVSDSTRDRFKADSKYFSPEILPDDKTHIKFQGADYFFTEYWDALSAIFLIREDGSVTMGISLKVEADEHFCGTGERFDRIDLFGQQIDLVNENAHGVNSRRTYINIPFLLSSHPYGIFVHSTAKMKLDIGCHSSRSLQWLVEDDELDMFFIGGGNFQKIILNYQKITGFPKMTPLWSFGCWMSRCTYQSDEEVTQIAERLRDEKFPMDVLHLDTGWFATEWKCDWTFSKERFPDPEGFFKRMRDQGFRISLWEYPYVSPDVELSKTVREKGYVGKVTDPANAVEWGDTLDFTNLEAVEWYKSQLERLLKMGATTFKTDFGENIDETAIYENTDAQKYRNLFALLFQKATWEAIDATTGEPFNWARSGWAGSQRYPLHWSADCSSTFDGVTNSLWGGLQLGLSGFAFWSHDIGGFYTIEDFMNRKPSEVLYLRWTQHGVFSSHMRFHGLTPREPWEYPSISNILREWLRFRYALLPYILSESKKCCENGLPMIRALVFEWMDDPAIWNISDEYLFGDAFLVCPVFNDSGVRNVYLPEGKWVDFWSGEVILGPVRLKNIKSELSRMPLYVRYNSKVEFVEPVQYTDQLQEAERFSIQFDESYDGFDKSKLKKLIDI